MARNGQQDSLMLGFPHSPEAESGLICCCMLDGGETIQKCRSARIGPEHYYDQRLGEVCSVIYELTDQGHVAEPSSVALELQRRNRLVELGGFPWFSEITSFAPTSIEVPLYIKTVREMALRRRLKRDVIELNQLVSEGKATPDEVRDKVMRMLVEVDTQETPARIHTFNEKRPEHSDAELLGRSHYITRGMAAMIFGTTGIGKSALTMQWAICAALGKPFLGIPARRKCRSLIFNSEDMAEELDDVFFSIMQKMNLTPAERLEVDANVRIVSDEVSRGMFFLAVLQMQVLDFRPDLVWINPLHAYAGCDITDSTEMGRFLREGLNRINRHRTHAYMLVHHTPKPIRAKNTREAKWNEHAYEAAGSAELVNYCRAIVQLRAQEERGKFLLGLVKRGQRAGVMIEKEGASGKYLEATTEIPCRHSTEKVKREGWEAPFSLIYWEAGEASQLPVKEPEAKRPLDPVGKADERASDILFHFPASDEPAQTREDIARNVRSAEGVGRTALQKYLTSLEDRGLIARSGYGRWKRTPSGDTYIEGLLKKTP